MVFSLLYAAPLLGKPGHAHTDIPTQAGISQLQAIEIIDRHVRVNIPDVQETKLSFSLYNFSDSEYNKGGLNQYADYRSKLGFGWTISHVKENPELLRLPLRFIDVNGSVYIVNQTAGSEKVCDEPSLTCLGRSVATFAKDRLFYFAEIGWKRTIEGTPYFDEGTYFIDAESGEILWDTIDARKNQKPMPNVNFNNKTIAQLFRERLDPPETAYVSIERGASIADNELGYLPKEIRTTLGIDNRIVWTNTDSVAHTVVSDTDYSNDYAGRFESKLIEPNGTYEYAFFDVGSYPYHCEIHPHMRGLVEVIENFA